MPVVIPRSTPPKPPSGSTGPIAQLDDVARTQALLTGWAFALIAWLMPLMNQMQDDLNWLVQQQGARNLVPDSDIKEGSTYWTIGAGIAVTDGVGFGGGRAFTLTGGPVTADVVSSGIVVTTGGDQYVLSGWIDASLMTAGTVKWLVRDKFTLVEFAEVEQQIGASDRLQVLVEIPSTTAVAEVVLRFTAAEGDVVASQPQLELPRLAGHQGTITQPAATLYRSNVGEH